MDPYSAQYEWADTQEWANGGAPSAVGPTTVHGYLIRGTWRAQGRLFYKLQGPRGGIYYGTYKRDGTFKTWRAYRPLVLGKRPTPAKAKRVVAWLTRFARTYEKVVEALGWTVYHYKPRRATKGGKK